MHVYIYTYTCILFAQLCLKLWTTWNVVLQAPLSMGFFQARILEWVAISFSIYIYIYTYICIYTYAYIYVYTHTCTVWTSQVELVVKNLLANAGNLIRDLGLISGSRTSGGGHATHSCLDYPMDKGAWAATVHRVTKCQTWLKRFSLHAYTVYIAVCTWHSKSP